jgi:hypothetical protein
MRGTRFVAIAALAGMAACIPELVPREEAPLELPLFDLSRLEISEPRMGSLSANEEARVSLDSTGCFHHFQYQFVFRGPSPISVEVSEVQGDGPGGESSFLGNVRLSPEDASRLDRLIAYYRLRRAGACTTRETVRVEWLKNGEVTLKEGFRDETCEPDFNEGLMALDRLARRARGTPDT